MKVERCSRCDGNDPGCYDCDGCGEVAIYTAREVREMRAKLERARVPSVQEMGHLTEEQSERFLEIAIKPGATMLDEDPILEPPDVRHWECGACGNIMVRALQPKQCCKCGVNFLFS